MIEAAFFDLDGTLVDSNEFHVVAWARAFARNGLAIKRRVLRAQIGKGADLLIPDIFPDLDETRINAIAEDHGEIFKRDFLKLVKPFPRAAELIAAWHRAGVRIVLASSAAKKEVDYYADLLKIENFVSAAVSMDDVKRSKPEPDIFALALNNIRIPADAAVVIGDTPYDGKAAAKCQIPSILLRSGGYSDETLQQETPEQIFDDVADLYACIPEPAR